MVIYVNEKGAVRSIPSSVPQGTVLRSVVVIAPEGAAETLVLKVFPPSQEKIPDIICQPALDVDGNVVCTASIPAAVTKYAGKAEYQIFAYNKEKEVFPSDRGSFTVTRGVLTDMPDTVEELGKYSINDLYSLLTNVNRVYELLNDTQSEFNDLNDIVNALVTGISQKVDKLKPNDKLPWAYVANPDGTQGYRVLTAATTPETVMYRDENGRSQVELPSQPKDIANKLFVESAIAGLQSNLKANIEEVEIIAKGATKAIAFISYSNLVTDLNQADATKYSVGQPFLIGTVDVPDLWVFAVLPEPIPYDYDDDDSIVEELESKNFITIGYYVLAPLETQKVDLAEYVKQDSLRGKMDVPPVSTEFTRVPTVETDGSQSYNSLTDEATAGTIAFRYTDGRLRVGTPVEENDATNKSYVENNFSNAFKGTEHGTIVAMDDVSPIPHKVKAKTSSKNLLCVDANGYYQHVTVNVLDNNGFTVETSTTEEAPLYEFWKGELPAGRYTISFNVDIENNVDEDRPNEILIFVNDVVRSICKVGNVFPNSIEYWFTVPNQAEYNTVTLAFYVNVGVAEYNNYKATFTNIQLEAGTVATEFTPYVADDTEITVKSCGKNLIPFPYYDGMTKAEDGVTFTVNENGSITVNGINNERDAYFALQVNCNYGEVMNAINEPLGKSNGTYAISYGLFYNDNNRVLAVAIPKGTNCYNEIFYPQVEKGTVATEYEPYKEGETITTTIAEGAELNSIAPNMTIATDIDGVTIDAEYNKDSNRVIEKLTQAIISLGGNI